MFEEAILSEEQLRDIDDLCYLAACALSEQYGGSLSLRWWDSDRPADRRRYWDTQGRDGVLRQVAQAQHLATLREVVNKFSVIEVILDELEHQANNLGYRLGPDVTHELRQKWAALRQTAGVLQGSTGSADTRVHVTITTEGDPSVGIWGTTDTIMLDIDLEHDAYERERVRDELAQAWGVLHDDIATVRFSDECPSCGRQLVAGQPCICEATAGGE